MKKSTINPTIMANMALLAAREIDNATIVNTIVPMIPISKHFKLFLKQCVNLAHSSLHGLKNTLIKTKIKEKAAIPKATHIPTVTAVIYPR